MLMTTRRENLLSQHLLQIINTSATNLLLNLSLKRLIVKVQQLLAVERLQTTKNTLSDTSNGNSTDDFAFEIKFVLGCCSNVPFSGLDLLVSWNEVTDEDKDGHDDMFSDRDDV